MADVWFLADDGVHYEMGGVDYRAELLEYALTRPLADVTAKSWSPLHMGAQLEFQAEAVIHLDGEAVPESLLKRIWLAAAGKASMPRGRLVVGQDEAIVGEFPNAVVVRRVVSAVERYRQQPPRITFRAEYPFLATFDQGNGEILTILPPYVTLTLA